MEAVFEMLVSVGELRNIDLFERGHYAVQVCVHYGSPAVIASFDSILGVEGESQTEVGSPMRASALYGHHSVTAPFMDASMLSAASSTSTSPSGSSRAGHAVLSRKGNRAVLTSPTCYIQYSDQVESMHAAATGRVCIPLSSSSNLGSIVFILCLVFHQFC